MSLSRSRVVNIMPLASLIKCEKGPVSPDQTTENTMRSVLCNCLSRYQQKTSAVSQ